jgi:hypothetical protein
MPSGAPWPARADVTEPLNPVFYEYDYITIKSFELTYVNDVQS